MNEEILDDDAAFEARAQARVGTTLRDKYRLDRVLGFGGMATVYAATHRNGNEVALKLLHPEIAHHSDIRGRFLREGYVANQVKHPGAVSVLDDDSTEDGGSFLVMELLRGLTVQELWDSRGPRLHPACVTAIILQLLDVMDSAHAHGVIHRDLKPANLFVTREGELKVLDFGIARLRDTGLRTTNAGSVLGTPAFMAPEQAMAKSKEIDPQTDLWAIGSVAFALLVGDVVHPAENTQQTLILAATQSAPPVGSFAPDLPGVLAAVFDQALAFEKADRWASAATMKAALEHAAREAFGEVPGEAVLRAALEGGTKVLRAAPVATTSLATTDLPVASRPRAATAHDPATMPGLAAPARAIDRGRARGIAGTALIAFSVVAAAMFLLRTTAPAAASASSGAPMAPPTAVEVASASSLVGVDSVPQEPETLADTVSSEANATLVTRSTPWRQPPPSPSATPKRSAAAISAPHCAPPYTIDSTTHRKTWKLECL